MWIFTIVSKSHTSSFLNFKTTYMDILCWYSAGYGCVMNQPKTVLRSNNSLFDDKFAIWAGFEGNTLCLFWDSLARVAG